MRFSNLKQEKGVAGTTVLLGLIVSLFIIGLIVMIFALMGGSLKNASYTTNTTTFTNVSQNSTGTIAYVNSTGFTVADSGELNFVLNNVTSVWASTTAGYPYNLSVPAANYTFTSAGVISNSTATSYNNVSVSFIESYSVNNDATNVIGNTTSSLSSVTDFFALFIVIGSMVVLILLTVIIIVAIRQSGLLSGGTA